MFHAGLIYMHARQLLATLQRAPAEKRERSREGLGEQMNGSEPSTVRLCDGMEQVATCIGLFCCKTRRRDESRTCLNMLSGVIQN